MYWGSVRFYKHLIFIVIALLIIIPTIGCFSFGFAYHNLKEKVSTEGMDASTTAADQKLGIQNKDLTYQNKYPDLYIKKDKNSEFIKEKGKTIYLTFDDGPSARTAEILDILKEKEIHATFFVRYREDKESQKIYKRIVKEGHAIGVRSKSEDYNAIYQSVETYLKDFAETAKLIETATDKKPEIFRFPGGSINAYNNEIYQELIAEMLRRGYTYYDWNVASGDASAKATPKVIYNTVTNGIADRERAIVLMHDSSSKMATVAALPDIIKNLQSEGYRFEALNHTIRPICFSYIN